MFAWIVFFCMHGSAAEIKNIPQIGPHFRILTVDKNENPQNLLAIYTKLNPDCTLAGDEATKTPLLGYYWLMDHQNYKRVHPLILRGIRNRLALLPTKDPAAFSIAFTDLKELDTDIADHDIKVTAHRENGRCAVDATLQLGPSDAMERIHLTNIHSEAKKTFFPPFRKVTSVTLDGVDIKTGHAVHRKYSAKD